MPSSAAGGGSCSAALSRGWCAAVIPLAFNINVWQQYADAMANRPPSQWLSPTLGSLLRLAFDEHLFRLQFVPMAAGLVWFAWHWRKTRYWNWREQLPLLLLVSFVTAPYGAWPFDMVLLLPAAIALFVSWDRGRLGRAAGIPGGLAAINLGCLILNLLKFSSFWFLWVSPAVLLLYAMGTRQSAPVADDPVVPAPREREAVPA